MKPKYYTDTLPKRFFSHTNYLLFYSTIDKQLYIIKDTNINKKEIYTLFSNVYDTVGYTNMEKSILYCGAGEMSANTCYKTYICIGKYICTNTNLQNCHISILDKNGIIVGHTTKELDLPKSEIVCEYNDKSIGKDWIMALKKSAKICSNIFNKQSQEYDTDSDSDTNIYDYDYSTCVGIIKLIDEGKYHQAVREYSYMDTSPRELVYSKIPRDLHYKYVMD